MAELVSQREYARRKGWNPGYVSKLKTSGKLVLEDDGKGGVLVNVEASDAKLAANSDPSRDYMADVNAEQRERHNKPDPAQIAAAAATELGRASAFTPGANLGAGTRPDSAVVAVSQKARAQALVWDAKAKQLAYEKAVGKLVDAEEVRKVAYERARTARKAIESVADRLAPRLAVETQVGRIYDLMMSEFRKVFAELAGGEEDAGGLEQ
jgi:hypothetical protein